MNKQRSIKPLAIMMLGILANGAAVAAETVFYSNTTNPNALAPTQSLYYPYTSGYELADDMPFIGTQRVSSFKIGYKSPEPVHVTFRFYGVDQDTGLPGALVAQIERDLPAGEATPTIVLDDSEKFNFTAEPNLFNQNITGGWFSMRFKSLVDATDDAQLRLAGYTSQPYFYNLDTGIRAGVVDPNGAISPPTSATAPAASSCRPR
ncbi:MAG: hypothetical protein ACOY5W_07005 [Pseudomonadota bacterium]